MINKFDKKFTIEQLLNSGHSLNLHLDPRNDACIVPKQFKNQDTLVLTIGYNMDTPMVKFNLTEKEIFVTLSFSRQKFDCSLPLDSIFLVNILNTQLGAVWEE